MIVPLLSGCNGFPNGTVSQPGGKVIVNGEQYTMISQVISNNYNGRIEESKIQKLKREIRSSLKIRRFYSKNKFKTSYTLLKV
ncbi:hypothetical protein B1B04_04065 [Lysinibacillus sp. KCTC 33748]|nr:hypothetical protein B1B04_04065 [Lysinibacillus sp. KCTC 33748]